jgi:signal transduction histidine kinase
MTLLRQCMAWGIGLNPFHRGKLKAARLGRSPFSLQALSLKLLLSYLGAMGIVLGLSAGVVYQFFAYSLAQKLDLHLLTVAQAARHNFAAIQRNPAAAKYKQPTTIDQDKDLDLPWQDLSKITDTVEWFNASGQLLSIAGYSRLPRLFAYHIQPVQQGKVRSLTIPVGTNQIPTGYVRVSTDTHEMEENLCQLLLGLGLGGTVAIALVGASGWWLTRRSLLPMERTLEKLQQFTADASHELRGPITAIQTALEVMQSHPERVHSADVKKLAMMTQATQHMAHLMDDLLLLARADQNLKMTGTTLIPLHELLEDLAEGYQSKAALAGLHLQTESLNSSWVQGNAEQLSRVFLNLLDNAIKYTPSGGTLRLSLVQKEAIAQVRITDTGIGINSAHLPQIFDRFWQADPSRSRKAGGTGLGLAIAQAIVEAHSGKIIVQSQLGVGSCFQVELPSQSIKSD